jgi:hypothetical protein
MFPPWMIGNTLTVPQYYGLWNRESLHIHSVDDAVALANRKRQRKGQQPLKTGTPSCIKRTGIIRPKKGKSQ